MQLLRMHSVVSALKISSMKNTLLCALRRKSSLRAFSIALFSTMFGVLFISLVEYVWFYPRTMLCFFTILGMMWALIRIAAKEAKEKETD